MNVAADQAETISKRRGELRRQAQDLLRKPGGDPQELLNRAEELKKLNEFGYARRLLGRAREQQTRDPELRRQLRQRHALCTYKDADLPGYEKLRRALDILGSGEEDLRSTSDQETLGLAGAIYKRLWQVDGNKGHLEQSLAYYLRGYEAGVEKDHGYTAINAAHILDQLASLEEEGARITGRDSQLVQERRNLARTIRETVVSTLRRQAEAESRLKEQWWFQVTIAEAHFGLQQYDLAAESLRRARRIPDVPQWEFESTAVQLASTARLQARGVPENEEDTRAWQVLEEFLDGRADAVRSVFAGKLGIALSGGGFRASFFHIGVLAKLAELDLLRHVHVLSCVSGGSIVGAHYYLELRELLQSKHDKGGDRAGADAKEAKETADQDGNEPEPIAREDYIAIVERMQRDFLDGVQRNIRVRVVGNLAKCLHMTFSSTYSRTVRAGELFEKEIYARIKDRGGSQRHISGLTVQPKGEEAFNPKSDNWLRRNKVPMLVLNATTLNTGHNWQFTATWMGESPFAIDTEIDANWRYRRMYYDEAPERYRTVRLGTAVGASACVPGLFEPVPFPDLYPKDEGLPDMTVRLVDGGVHDNQGVGSLLEQGCTVLFISDASGQMNSDPQPKGGVFGPLLRASSVSMERVRWSQFAHLKSREQSGLLKGLAVVHLKKGLVVDPVSWKHCTEPADDPPRLPELLDYGVVPRVQALLAGIRTDLDSFSDVEAYALMASGYMMADRYARELRGFQMHESTHPWTFLRLRDAMEGRAPEKQQARFEKLLEVGAQRAFKVWRISKVLGGVAAIGALALVVGLFVLWSRFADVVLLRIDVGWVGETLFWLVAALLIGKTAISILRYGNTLRKVLADLGIALVGWLVARVHLWVFDPLFLRWGRLERIVGDEGDAGRG